ncbi:thymidylate synthase [Actinokineospora globicatena]|uniref:thymidylate synthase n=1 Tax=Actinokineospora globicatena TaxID=103729 RepID=UPI0020A60F3D|nr:thymidylate synthase [Actinokineospora globicatena]MCP2304541.1 thymidylate synthase [Actinokineospora globicatena]GLW78090.1 thymidylate synthase [Actinokineospora globicatena]GLW85244.1 thymidylate synthase [Actinokineospora globicatena]
MEFDTFHHAYAAVLRSVAEEPTYRNAPRGNASRERIGVQYRVREAAQRVPVIPARRLNIVFNFAEALWYLSGRDDLAFIATYAPSIRKYSADGVRLTGTAYGNAIFGRDQWRTVVDQLRADPDSKRAVLQIFRGEELRVPANPDVSCTLGLQLLIRDGALHAIGFMRANDAYRGMSSDVFSFTFLQEVMARELGLPVGEYVHSVGSLHVYDPDSRRVDAVLADPATRVDPEFRFPGMPEGDNWPAIREVLLLEESLRAGNRLGSTVDLPEYWADVVRLFELHRRVRAGEVVDEELLHPLPPLYRNLITHWQPRLVAAPTS